MIFRGDRIMGSGQLQSGLIFFVALLACSSYSLAQGAAPAASGNASAVVVGSCNVVQQNVTAGESATIINEINCVPEKPEDSFLLRYLWLDATTTSFMVAGRFDPALARVLPANPVVVRNPVFEKVQEIVTRFGLPVNSSAEPGRFGTIAEPFKPGNSYIINRKGQEGSGFTGNGLQASPAIRKKMRIYAGEENIIWPDVPSLRTVFRTQEWPSNYKMTYEDPVDPEGWKKPQAHVDYQNAVISCVRLHAPVSAPLLMNYSDSIAELANTVLKKEFRPQEFINSKYGTMLADDSYKSIKLRNKAIDAMLYFGQRNWPDDFLLVARFSQIDG